eukprot:3028219-Amphidinium_carterae.1
MRSVIVLSLGLALSWMCPARPACSTKEKQRQHPLLALESARLQAREEVPHSHNDGVVESGDLSIFQASRARSTWVPCFPRWISTRRLLQRLVLDLEESSSKHEVRAIHFAGCSSRPPARLSDSPRIYGFKLCAWQAWAHKCLGADPSVGVIASEVPPAALTSPVKSKLPRHGRSPFVCSSFGSRAKMAQSNKVTEQQMDCPTSFYPASARDGPEKHQNWKQTKKCR